MLPKRQQPREDKCLTISHEYGERTRSKGNSPILFRIRSVRTPGRVARSSKWLLLNGRGSRASRTSTMTSARSRTDFKFGRSRLMSIGGSSTAWTADALSFIWKLDTVLALILATPKVCSEPSPSESAFASGSAFDAIFFSFRSCFSSAAYTIL